MKKLIFIFILGFSIPFFGQKWTLNNIDLNREFSYEYWFRIENLNDISSYKLTKNKELSLSTIILCDNEKVEVNFANVVLIDIENKTKTNLYSDFEGKLKINLKKGVYKIEVSSVIHDYFELKFELDSNESIDLKINLGLAPELDFRAIQSKNELDESEIIMIINCVENNKRNYLKECSFYKNYRLLLVF